MNFELLKRLNPDHSIKLDKSSRLITSASSSLLIEFAIDKSEMVLGVTFPDFISQLTKRMHPRKFIRQVSEFINSVEESYSLMLLALSSGITEEKPVQGSYLFLLRLNLDDGVEVEFFNLIGLSNLIFELFSCQLWHNFSLMAIANKDYFEEQQLFLAHKSILPLFLLTHLSEANLQAKSKRDFGELLFYFNPHSKNNEPAPSSARNLLHEGLIRSRHELKGKETGDKERHKKLIINNLLSVDCFIRLF